MTRLTALLLTLITGFTGLVYEVTWEKYLATLLGSHSEATAAVLGIFLGGLSLGYSLFGILTRRIVERAQATGKPARLLLLYGLVEGSIGAYIIAFPLVFRAIQALSLLIPHGAAGPGFAIDVLLSALLIGPPTVLMGGTIPILTQALAGSVASSTRFHAFVYAFNTTGAFLGALAAGFFLIPALGLVRLMFAMGAINLLAGATFVALGRRSAAPATVEEAPAAPAKAAKLGAYAAAALLTGFAMMVLQTVLIRLGGLSFGASQFTFSMVVAVFVLCIALGSFCVSAFSRIPRAVLVINQWLLALLVCLLYAFLEHTPYGAHVLRTLFRDTPQAFYAYYGTAFLAVLLMVGPPVVLSGATLPLLFHHLRRSMGDLGAVAGKLYSWNTLGSLLGALLGGYALLFWFDLHLVCRVGIAALACAAAILTAKVYEISRIKTVALMLAPALGALALLAPWDPSHLAIGLFRSRQPLEYSYQGPQALYKSMPRLSNMLFYTDDPVASIAVFERRLRGQPLARSIVNNGKSDGNTVGDYPTMGLAAIIPALITERTERAFVIGYGTGVTAGELASLQSMQEVVVAEISPGVIRAAPFFDFANQGASKSPRVEILRSDAYRALLRDSSRYDVIVSEPSNPWVTGVEMLYSREFLEAARSRLRPGGIYVQWYHQYETSQEAVELVFRTYASVFPSVAVWFGKGPGLLILGSLEEKMELDLERLQRRARRPDFAAALRRCGVSDFPGLLAHEILPFGVVHAAKLQGPLHTLYHPRLSHEAALAFFRGSGATLPFTGFAAPARQGAQSSLFLRYLAGIAPDLREAAYEGAARELCAKRKGACIALLAKWWAARPRSEKLWALANDFNRKRPFPGNIRKELQRIGVLFPGSRQALPEALPLLELRSTTNAFEQSYSHAAPFSAEALLELWSRCRAPESMPRACEEGLEEARALVTTGRRRPGPQ